jgi:hypothetical protein
LAVEREGASWLVLRDAGCQGLGPGPGFSPCVDTEGVVEENADVPPPAAGTLDMALWRVVWEVLNAWE